ncbi:MAG: hypothetical protein A2V96_01430 [Candidatus Yonathbacteria bacterium RBG_16_43_6]|uniref:Uncharacterized protein n=2 Tax=Parcubacteria group TaxID=1794811 RepID=A0A1G2SC13_9BACT|nr:MAG: hypothetical protein UW78_C0001G0016 [Candidatus Azambacteria bacterium GW2011_GWA1_44_9]OHA78560.1 MAG: hypothetical protein A2658_02110 [Candidatus Yonathbacteria bacterium RIFCSPHIGHO2_01_FULL_44_19]OHA80198.1 MAG: hypothetical protein A2V96_01430 [Candidatus Yonathbacteria bacterium RBG_16_43_6]OHA82298.1 MAG: hypothetical protein A3B07_02055 [Candidatus Yonathbacteria bacterium RIFCSPLOWO2_01_FULL_43_27]
MGMLEKIGQWVEEKVDPAEHRLEVTNKAQIELMMAFGEDKSGVWIDAYSRRFRELIDEEGSVLFNRLADSETHNDAIEEVKRKLYH